MIEQTPHSPNEATMDIHNLSAAIARVAGKIALATEAVQKLNQDRTQLENKIEDAQKRIQHILSRLPEQSDGRQLNLLGEVAAATNLEDDNEPTTH
jgi:peptidoglycan hydrolase CwlO-like protein